MNELQKLMDKLSSLEVESKALIAKDDATADEINAKLGEIKATKAKIEVQKQLDEAAEAQAAAIVEAQTKIKEPVNEPLYAEPKDKNQNKWKGGIGEFLKAVAKASNPNVANSERYDNRLVYNAASGASESIASEGGFLLEGNFVQSLMDAMGTQVQVKNRIRMLPLTTANKLNILGVDESSRATGSRWGGVQVYHANEAGTVASSKPKFRDFELKLEKIMALCYATDELLEDTSLLGNIITQAYADEVSFTIDDDIINGDGIGKALGILNSPALVTVPKETGQTSGTILPANINKMWVRMPARNKPNAVWYINQEVDTALTEMAFTVGTGGSIHPLALEYLSKGTLKGAPVVAIEQCAGLGSVGDIILVDPTQYVGIDKNTLAADTSIHVRFLNDEQVFRFIYRFNGAPYRNKAVTPYKGTATLSPFVTLASR